MSGVCLEGVRRVSGRCLEGVRKVSGRCVEDAGRSLQVIKKVLEAIKNHN